MDTLPNELLCKILGYLDYDELLVAKNVCQLWRSGVGYVIKRRPVVCVRVHEETNKYYLSANKLKDENHSPFWRLFYEKENRLNQLNHHLVSKSWKRFRMITEYHECIRKLIVSDPYLVSFLNTFVNCEDLQLITESWMCKDYQLDLKRHYWEQNEYLEFENLDEVFVARGNQFVAFKREESTFLYLNLTKLKKLHFITDLNFKKFPIMVSCPALRSIVTEVSLDCFNFKFPESVEEITCEENSPVLMQFRNLRKLTCYHFNHNFVSILKLFKLLKEFFFYKMDEHVVMSGDLEPIKVYYKNVQLLASQTWQNQLRSLSAFTMDDNALDFYSRNVRLLSPTAGLMHKELRLNWMEHVVPGVLQKLGNLQQVYINYQEAYRNDYIEIFKACSLKKLIIKSSYICSIDQQFLDFIPLHCPFLTLIRLDDFEDLSFCLNLKYLKCLKTEQFFSFELIQKLFDYLPSLGQIEVHVHVDIFRFEVVESLPICLVKPESRGSHLLKMVCSLNYSTFLEEPKQRFIAHGYRNCIWKLYELFFSKFEQ